MRRTRREISLGEQLRIGQRWCRDDGSVWTVKQIHRRDTVVELNRDGRRELVSFERLLKTSHTIEDQATGQLHLTATEGTRC